MSHMRRIDTVLLQREFHFSGIGQREREGSHGTRKEGRRIFLRTPQSVRITRRYCIVWQGRGSFSPAIFLSLSTNPLHHQERNEGEETK